MDRSLSGAPRTLYFSNIVVLSICTVIIIPALLVLYTNLLFALSDLYCYTGIILISGKNISISKKRCVHRGISTVTHKTMLLG